MIKNKVVERRGKIMEEKLRWAKPEVIVIDLKEYEQMITANASSGSSCGSCSGGGGCNDWYMWI